MSKKENQIPGAETREPNVQGKMASSALNSYVISVSLGTGCYRHIRISVEDKLEYLHTAILGAFGFDDDHAHAFFLDNHLWSDTECYYSAESENGSRYTRDYALQEVDLQLGQPFKYVFDFGDCWTFQLKLLKILKEPTDDPQVTRSVGEAPAQYVNAKDEDEFEDEDIVYAEEEPEYDDTDEEESNYPEIYPPKMLKALYKTVALPMETGRLLHQYFAAFANLYGILPLRKALEIYNGQNPPLEEKLFSQYTEIMSHEENPFIILGDEHLDPEIWKASMTMDSEIIAEYVLVGEDGYKEMMASHGRKPYYIPEKTELLRYADDCYFEKNASFLSLVEFLRIHMKFPSQKVESIMDELQLHASMAQMDMQYILNDMQRMGLTFPKGDDLQLFLDRFTSMRNNTRMATNRGHTPMELVKTSDPPRAIKLMSGIKDSIRRGELDVNEMRKEVVKMAFPNTDMQHSYLKELDRIERELKKEHEAAPAPVQLAKTGRNATCPCGSGKKYKNCCEKNNEKK